MINSQVNARRREHFVRVGALLLLLVGIAGLAVGVTSAAGSQPDGTPRWKLSSFGTRAPGAHFDHTINFVAEQDDEIVSVHTSCGCTINGMALPRKVQAGETVPITVKVALTRASDDFQVRARVNLRSGLTQDFLIHGRVVPKAQQ